MLNSMARRARDGGAPLLRWLAGFVAGFVALLYFLRGTGSSIRLQPVHVQARVRAPRTMMRSCWAPGALCLTPRFTAWLVDTAQPGKLHVLVTVRLREPRGSPTPGPAARLHTHTLMLLRG